MMTPGWQDDIHPLKEGKEGESKGQRLLSWIWRIVGVGGDSANKGLQEGKFIIIIHFSILPTWISDEFGTTSPPHRVVSKLRPGNVKKCAECLPFLSGMPDGGKSEGVCELGCWMRRARVLLHMPISRHIYSNQCGQGLSTSGTARTNLPSWVSVRTMIF